MSIAPAATLPLNARRDDRPAPALRRPPDPLRRARLAVAIDPLVRFGRPSVQGVATGYLWELLDARNTLEEIGAGYELVRAAVTYEEQLRTLAARPPTVSAASSSPGGGARPRPTAWPPTRGAKTAAVLCGAGPAPR